MQQLVAIGYVEVETDATWTASPTYRLHPEVLEKPTRDQMGPEKARGRQTVTPPDEVTPSAPTGDTEGTPEVTPTTATGDKPSPLTVSEPSTEPPGTATPERFTDEPPTPEIALFPAASQIEEGFVTDFTVAKDNGWDALVALFGYEPHGKAEQDIWSKIADRADAEPDPADAVQRRARALVGQWGLAKLTPASLNKWWDRFDSQIGTGTEADQTEFNERYERAQRREKAAEMERT